MIKNTTFIFTLLFGLISNLSLFAIDSDIAFPTFIPKEFVLVGETVAKDRFPREKINIRDQGRCGSCSAFATMSMIESHLAVFGDKDGLYQPGQKLSVYTAFVGAAIRGGLFSDQLCNRGIAISVILRAAIRNDLNLVHENHYPDSLVVSKYFNYKLLSKEQFTNDAPIIATSGDTLVSYRLNTSGAVKIKTAEEMMEILKSGRTITVSIWTGPTYNQTTKIVNNPPLELDWFEWDAGTAPKEYRIFPGTLCNANAGSKDCWGNWHAVEIVGYDSRYDTPFWIAKNSASAHYGINPYPGFTSEKGNRGYMRLNMKTAFLRSGFALNLPYE